MQTGRKWNEPIKQGEKWRLRQGVSGYYTLFVDTGPTDVWSAIVGCFSYVPTDEEIQRAIVLYRLGEC